MTKGRSARCSLHFLALATLVATTGCGGAGGGSDAERARPYKPEGSTMMTTASITKAQFLSLANKQCRRAWKIILGNWHEYSDAQDRELPRRKRFEEAVQLSLLAGIGFHIFDEIRQIGAPQGEVRTVEGIIAPFRVAIELGWKKRWLAYSAAEVTRHFGTYNDRAGRYGLHDCLVTTQRLQSIDA